MSNRKSSVRKRSVVSKRSSSHFTASKRMKEDGRGFRGRDAEKQVLAKLEKRGWTCFHDFSRGHDILAVKKDRQVYIDVKEINEFVSSGSNKVERGRIQVNKKEEWKGFKAKKVWELIKNRKSDPIKLSWSELESIGEWKKEPTIK